MNENEDRIEELYAFLDKVEISDQDNCKKMPYQDLQIKINKNHIVIETYDKQCIFSYEYNFN